MIYVIRHRYNVERITVELLRYSQETKSKKGASSKNPGLRCLYMNAQRMANKKD